MQRPGRKRVRVVLAQAVGPFDYLLPEGLAAAPGQVVLVPLGSRQVHGMAADEPPDANFPESRLKPIEAIVPGLVLGPALRRFIDWVAAYTLAPAGLVLRMALPAAAFQPPPASVPAAWAAGGVPGKLSAARRKVLAALEAPGALAAAALAEAAGVSDALVKAMAREGQLVPAGILPPPPPPPPVLSARQAEAAGRLRATLGAATPGVTLLEGVTGAGKTEVYMEAVAEALAEGRQALVLLPEIALSAGMLARFRARFGEAALPWHSALPGRARRLAWHAALAGEPKVFIGARSALFLPLQSPGLIVVDEEHDPSFKQEDGVIYNARDMAVVRARLSQAACVLVSATPSFETLFNVAQGRYAHLTLPARALGALMPRVSALDLRAAPPGRGKFIAPPLAGAVEATLAAGEQALLFVNRRGYAPLTLCRACGHRMKCPNCTAWLVEHRLRRALVCHHCGHVERLPEICPACGAEGSLTPLGPGVERLTEEAAEKFPDARTAIMSSDTMADPEAASLLVGQVAAGEKNLVIGTQVAAKGWHFPNLTLVGVIDADAGLSGGDLRAAERTHALLHQVSGRAGREDKPGRVILQTYAPDDPVIAALVSGDTEKFRAEEMALRELGGWPPIGRLVALIVSAADAATADAAGWALARAAPRAEGVTVLGPAEAPLAVLRGQHRRRLLMKFSRGISGQELVRGWLAAAEVPRAARVVVDVDPQSFL
ncbi:MAG: primosomal protein N' [Acetobacteraceae bacterium]|nr:primosomal protein N' [Acetobacteraceae bacterium]